MYKYIYESYKKPPILKHRNEEKEGSCMVQKKNLGFGIINKTEADDN